MEAGSRTAFAGQLSRVARIRVAPANWDPHLRACALSAAAALAIAILVPGLGELAIFFTVMLVACGPTSAFLPAASEPVLMANGQLYPPLLIATLGVGAVVVVEFLNYSVFDSILNWERLAKIREARLTGVMTGWFSLQPFATVSVAALTPIPFWIARSCAVLCRYSKPRYICATALGRFLRLYLICALGSALPLDTGQILLAGGAIVALLYSASLVSHMRNRSHELTTA